MHRGYLITILIFFLMIEARAQRIDSTLRDMKMPINSSDSTKNVQIIETENGYLQVPPPQFSISEIPKRAQDTTNLNFKDTDLRDVFRAISIQHGLNIFPDNTISKRVTISLNDVTVIAALEFLCNESQLVLQYHGGIFTIAPTPPPLTPEPSPSHRPIVSYDESEISLQLQNDEVEKVVDEIHKITGNNILLLSGTTGTITGTLSKIDFDIGFTQIMNNNGFAVQKKNGIYIVSRLDYFVGSQSALPAQQHSGPYWVSVRDSLVTMDVTNAPLDRVLPDIVRQLNRDLVVYSPLSGTITIRATNVPIAKALDIILRNTNYSYREAEGLFFVGEKSVKALTLTKLFRLKYLRVDKILDMIPQSISSQAVIKPLKEHNGIVVISTNDVIEQVRDLLAAIDKPVAQVLIEALVVDYDLTHGSEFGIDMGLFGKPDTTGIERIGSYIPRVDVEAHGTWLNRQLEKAGHVNLFGHDLDLASLGNLSPDFYVRLRALEEKGLANVKSRPLIATLNGQQASLSIGTTQYFLLKTTTPYRDQNQVIFQESQNFQTVEADVKLEITPYVGVDSTMTVEIKPDFRTPVGQFSPNVPPTINRRALSSTIVIKDGETIVLGGLIEESETESRTQVPLLGSIPILGNLFSSTKKTNRKSELIIYVTPHISYGGSFQNVSLPVNGE